MMQQEGADGKNLLPQPTYHYQHPPVYQGQPTQQYLPPQGQQYQNYSPNVGIDPRAQQYRQPINPNQPLLKVDREIDQTAIVLVLIIILGILFCIPFFHFLAFLGGVLAYVIIRGGTTHAKTVAYLNVLLAMSVLHLVVFILVIVFFPVTFPALGGLILVVMAIPCCPCIMICLIIVCIAGCAGNSSKSNTS